MFKPYKNPQKNLLRKARKATIKRKNKRSLFWVKSRLSEQVTLDFQSRYWVTHFARSLQLPSSPPMRRRKATFNTASICACRFFLRLRLLFLKSCRFFGLCLRHALNKKRLIASFFCLFFLRRFGWIALSKRLAGIVFSTDIQSLLCFITQL